MAEPPDPRRPAAVPALPPAVGGGRHGHPPVRRPLRHHAARMAADRDAGQPRRLGSSQLAEHAQLDRARTSKAVGSLVAKRPASAHPSGRAADRRHVLLRLTDEGSGSMTSFFPLVSAINAQLLSALDASQPPRAGRVPVASAGAGRSARRRSGAAEGRPRPARHGLRHCAAEAACASASVQLHAGGLDDPAVARAAGVQVLLRGGAGFAQRHHVQRPPGGS